MERCGVVLIFMKRQFVLEKGWVCLGWVLGQGLGFGGRSGWEGWGFYDWD